jgi:hypothetical protein
MPEVQQITLTSLFLTSPVNGRLFTNSRFDVDVGAAMIISQSPSTPGGSRQPHPGLISRGIGKEEDSKVTKAKSTNDRQPMQM